MPAKKVAKRPTSAKRSTSAKKSSATHGSTAAKKTPAARKTPAAKKRSSAKAPWKRKAPPGSKHTTLTPEQKAWAKAQAKKAGRRYPNLVDNMRAAQRG